MTSQCFCMNSTSGRDGCIAMRCTQWPTSAVGSGMYSRVQAPVDRFPRRAGVVGAERARGRDGDEHPLRDRSGPEGSCAGTCRLRPAASADPEPWPRNPESSCQDLPPSVVRNNAASSTPGIDRVRIGERRLQMPDSLELPGMRRAVVPLVRAGDAVVDELVIHRLPGLAAVVRALDQLPEPAAGLRRIQAIRIDRRSLRRDTSPSRRSAGR